MHIAGVTASRAERCTVQVTLVSLNLLPIPMGMGRGPAVEPSIQTRHGVRRAEDGDTLNCGSGSVNPVACHKL